MYSPYHNPVEYKSHAIFEYIFLETSHQILISLTVLIELQGAIKFEVNKVQNC